MTVTPLKMVSKPLLFHKLPLESLSFGSHCPRVEALTWAYGMGTGTLLGLGSASTEDEDEVEAFRPAQLFTFDDILEFDDLHGTHALMVRAQGLGRVLLRWRESTGV